MELSSDLAFRGSLPLVLHKVVADKPLDWTDVRTNEFYRLIDYIGDRWTLPQVNLTEETPSWMLTFDDGNISDYEIVFPLLIEKQIKATFFLITNRIGTRGYLNWAQVLEMHRNGMCIGSHSCNHLSMNNISRKDAIREFKESKIIIEDYLGASVSSFSYPFGDYSLELNRLGIHAGYQFLFSSRHGIINSPSNIIPRNSINASMDWFSISKEINPSLRRRFEWSIEDNLKSIIKFLLGKGSYVRLRNKIYKN